MRTLRYIPTFNKATGSVNATLLMLQLEYWFSKNTEGTFFKFLEPCAHSAYRTGDSWIEELGFSKAEFRHAFSQIGKVYKSKTAYKNSPDPFEGKLYLSYFDRIRKMTYYIRNTTKVNELLSLNSDSEDGLSLDDNTILPQKNKTKTTTTPCPTPYSKIVDYFHSVCPHLSLVKHLTPTRKKSLDTLWHHVHFSLEAIHHAFRLVAQNDFLSGRLEGKDWKACFDWIIAIPSFIKITNAHYTAYTTTNPSNHTSKSKNLGFNAMYQHEWDFDALEKLEDEYITRKLMGSSNKKRIS